MFQQDPVMLVVTLWSEPRLLQSVHPLSKHVWRSVLLIPLKSKRQLASQVWRKTARTLFKRVAGRGLFSSCPPWMFLHWGSFTNVLGVLGPPPPLGQMTGLAHTMNSWYRQSGELWTPEGWSCFLLYSSVLTRGGGGTGGESHWRGKGNVKPVLLLG